MIKYICDFCKKEIGDKQEVRTLTWLVNKTKKTIHLHKGCLLDYAKDISEDVENTTDKVDTAVNREDVTVAKEKVVPDTDLSASEISPIPTNTCSTNEASEKLTEDSYSTKILRGTTTYRREPVEYKPTKRYKGLFTEVQRILLSKYIHGVVNIGLKHTGLSYVQAYNWITKFENKELMDVFKYEKVTEVIDDKTYDVKTICNLFVSGRNIDWIAYDENCDEAIIKRIIDKYSGVVLIRE